MSDYLTSRSKVQGAVLLAVGGLTAICGGLLSLLLLTGVATGSRAPYGLALYGLVVAVIGRKAYKCEGAKLGWVTRNPAPAVALFTLLVLVSIGVAARLAGPGL